MLDKMSDTSRLVERLRKKGLVKRKICPKDRRKAAVLMTEKGLNLLAEFDKLDNEFNSFFSNISEQEATLLNNLMDKIRG